MSDIMEERGASEHSQEFVPVTSRRFFSHASCPVPKLQPDRNVKPAAAQVPQQGMVLFKGSPCVQLPFGALINFPVNTASMYFVNSFLAFGP